MGLLDDLVVANSSGRVVGANLAVDVGGAGDAQVLGTLVQLFGADDERAEVDLLRDGHAIGVVSREAAAAAIGDGLKGVGASDGMLLPGVANYATSSWVCPKPGCRYTVVTIALGSTPHCARHPDVDLIEQF
jgi:hypothetical protein